LARSLYNNIVTPSKLVHGTDFHLFKVRHPKRLLLSFDSRPRRLPDTHPTCITHQEGIEPKWEDPKCARGGKWTFTVPKGNSRVPLDTYWLHVVLALIGEQFADPGEICGAVVNVRNRGDRISLWTRTGGNEAAQLSVGKQMKQVLDLNDSTKLGYMLHEDAMQQDRKAKDRYII
jgi:translation initiation factor 4E